MGGFLDDVKLGERGGRGRGSLEELLIGIVLLLALLEEVQGGGGGGGIPASPPPLLLPATRIILSQFNLLCLLELFRICYATQDMLSMRSRSAIERSDR
jgi:hypothetical protein